MVSMYDRSAKHYRDGGEFSLRSMCDQVSVDGVFFKEEFVTCDKCIAMIRERRRAEGGSNEELGAQHEHHAVTHCWTGFFDDPRRSLCKRRRYSDQVTSIIVRVTCKECLVLMQENGKNEAIPAIMSQMEKACLSQMDGKDMEIGMPKPVCQVCMRVPGCGGLCDECREAGAVWAARQAVAKRSWLTPESAFISRDLYKAKLRVEQSCGQPVVVPQVRMLPAEYAPEVSAPIAAFGCPCVRPWDGAFLSLMDGEVGLHDDKHKAKKSCKCGGTGHATDSGSAESVLLQEEIKRNVVGEHAYVNGKLCRWNGEFWDSADSNKTLPSTNPAAPVVKCTFPLAEAAKTMGGMLMDAESRKQWIGSEILCSDGRMRRWNGECWDVVDPRD